MPTNINLSSFAEGAVAERFEIELNKVLANIADPNTDAKKTRSLTITVTLKADEDRDIAMVSIQTKSNIAPAKNVETKIIMDRDNKGNVVGAELKSGVKGQMMMDHEGDLADDKGQKASNLVNFK